MRSRLDKIANIIHEGHLYTYTYVYVHPSMCVCVCAYERWCVCMCVRIADARVCSQGWVRQIHSTPKPLKTNWQENKKDMRRSYGWERSTYACAYLMCSRTCINFHTAPTLLKWGVTHTHTHSHTFFPFATRMYHAQDKIQTPHDLRCDMTQRSPRNRPGNLRLTPKYQSNSIRLLPSVIFRCDVTRRSISSALSQLIRSCCDFFHFSGQFFQTRKFHVHVLSMRTQTYHWCAHTDRDNAHTLTDRHRDPGSDTSFPARCTDTNPPPRTLSSSLSLSYRSSTARSLSFIFCLSHTHRSFVVLYLSPPPSPILRRALSMSLSYSVWLTPILGHNRTRARSLPYTPILRRSRPLRKSRFLLA